MPRTTFPLALIAAGLANTASADPVALDAYVTAFERSDPAACEASFAPGATFIDLGNDFSERLGWFCGAVVDGGGRYTITNATTVDDTTTFDLFYKAGGYELEGRGELKGLNGLIETLVIERR